MTDKYYSALLEISDRYDEMIVDHMLDKAYWSASIGRNKLLELRKFAVEFKQGCINSLPLCKLNRWLGYIQGTLITLGLTTVEKERDFTRPILRPLDFPDDKYE